MKLAIYETTHHETLPAMLDLGALFFDEVAVFLKASTYDNISGDRKPEDKWKNARFIIQPVTEKNRVFLKRIFYHIENGKFTHVHISTLDNNLLYFAFLLMKLRKVHVSLSIQAVNEFSGFRCKNLRDLSESLSKLYFHKRIRHFRVFFPLMAESLRKNFPSAIIQYIPPRFYSAYKKLPTRDADWFKIVIPGSVDPKRRDYEYVLRFLETNPAILHQHKPVWWVILGSAETAFAQKFLENLTNRMPGSNRITSYHENVSQSEYESQISSADLIWSPIRIETHGIRGSKELYSITAATGLTGDLLMNNIPALMPKDFIIPDHYEGTIIHYQTFSDLNEMMIGFLNRRIDHIEEKIARSLSYFTIDNFRDSFQLLMGIPA